MELVISQLTLDETAAGDPVLDIGVKTAANLVDR